MARYNAWQNNAILDELRVMDEGELTLDRGLFFGSIFGTLNHLLWGDLVWMSRFDGGQLPDASLQESALLLNGLEAYALLRFQTDGRIKAWAKELKTLDMTGDLTWFSGAANREISKPKAMCIAHFFNHQTHHRGQVHAALTSVGVATHDTDLFLMPEDT